MPATSHRTSFERWLRRYESLEPEEVREQRAEFGYEVSRWDLAFQAWKAAVNVERGRRKFLQQKRSAQQRNESHK